MATPLLLLSPDESRDASGPITPTVNASDVAVVAGQYATAWSFTGGNVKHSLGGVVSQGGGTLLVRAKAAATQPGTFAQIIHTGNELYLLAYSNTTLRGYVGSSGGAIFQQSGGVQVNAWATYAVRWDGSTYQASINTTHYAPVTQGTFGSTPATLSIGSNISGTIQPFTGQIESVMLFDAPLTDTELADVQDIPWSWTMLDAPVAVTTIRPQIIGLGSVAS